MDIRFTNRWGGFDYWELYGILDGLIDLVGSTGDQTLSSLIHEINLELANRLIIGRKT